MSSAVGRAKAETYKEFVEWTKKQAEYALDEMADAAPQRSGNLSDSLYLKPDGNDWVMSVDEQKAPYASIVLQGRGEIRPRNKKWLRFNDTRNGWKPMGNLARVTGQNAQKYPHLGNLRAYHMIPKVGGAPAIDFPGEGFDNWQSQILPGEVERLRSEILSIVVKNGGRVTGMS